MLHPGNGIRPVAEGIAGGPPPPKDPDQSICQSLLMELCEEGQQMVKVTQVHKKCILLMYPDGNASSEYLDDVVSPPAPSDTFVAWSTIYLVDKKEAL